MVLKAHLPADLGALLIKALDAAAEEIPTPRVPAGTCVPNVEPKEPPDERPTRAARRADAFAVLAETFIKHGGAPLNGGETKASNLVTLCRFHHRKVHEGGVTVQILDDGAFRFVKPDGTGFDTVATDRTTPLGHWTQLPRRHCEEGIHIDPSTATTRWRGERMDYGIAVEALLARSWRVPAGTSS